MIKILEILKNNENKNEKIKYGKMIIKEIKERIMDNNIGNPEFNNGNNIIISMEDETFEKWFGYNIKKFKNNKKYLEIDKDIYIGTNLFIFNILKYIKYNENDDINIKIDLEVKKLSFEQLLLLDLFI